jgi:hypothetical protein
MSPPDSTRTPALADGRLDSPERALVEAQAILRRVMASRSAPARDSLVTLVVAIEAVVRGGARGSR